MLVRWGYAYEGEIKTLDRNIKKEFAEYRVICNDIGKMNFKWESDGIKIVEKRLKK